MSKRIRILSLVLAILMLVPAALAGCSNDEKPENTVATTPAPVSSNASDPVPDSSGNETTADPNKIDLEGYEFVLRGRDPLLSGNPGDTALGAELQDIYDTIENDLNCLITVTDSIDCSAESLLAASVGGIKLADFLWCHQMNWIPIANLNGLRPPRDDDRCRP